jgi:hypothetical protein
VLAAFLLVSCGIARPEGPNAITVGKAGADFATIQAAVTAAPEDGAVIRIRPLINPFLLQQLWQNRINAYMQDVGLQLANKVSKHKPTKQKAGTPPGLC